MSRTFFLISAIKNFPILEEVPWIPKNRNRDNFCSESSSFRDCGGNTLESRKPRLSVCCSLGKSVVNLTRGETNIYSINVTMTVFKLNFSHTNSCTSFN